MSVTDAANVICPAPEPAPLLVTLRFCEDGGAPLTAWVNVSEVALVLMVFDDTTFNVTGNICGLLATVAGVVAVIVTVPV